MRRSGMLALARISLHACSTMLTVTGLPLGRTNARLGVRQRPSARSEIDVVKLKRHGLIQPASDQRQVTDARRILRPQRPVGLHLPHGSADALELLGQRVAVARRLGVATD